MNDDNLPIINGHKDPEIDGLTQQKVPCGAAVVLSEDVLKHGILFIHDDLPLFQLFLEVDIKTKGVKHTFQLVKPKTKLVKDFLVDVIRTEPKIATPKKEIIMPGG